MASAIAMTRIPNTIVNFPTTCAVQVLRFPSPRRKHPLMWMYPKTKRFRAIPIGQTLQHTVDGQGLDRVTPNLQQDDGRGSGRVTPDLQQDDGRGSGRVTPNLQQDDGRGSGRVTNQDNQDKDDRQPTKLAWCVRSGRTAVKERKSQKLQSPESHGRNGSDSTDSNSCSNQIFRLIAMGSRQTIIDNIKTLHCLGYAEVIAWSPLQRGFGENEFMSILTLRGSEAFSG